MTKKTFYDHMLNISDLEKHLGGDEELAFVVKKTLRNHAMVAILHVLPKEHHEVFLQEFDRQPDGQHHWQWLRERIKEDVEKIIKTEVAKVKKEILSDIHKSQ